MIRAAEWHLQGQSHAPGQGSGGGLDDTVLGCGMHFGCMAFSECDARGRDGVTIHAPCWSLRRFGVLGATRTSLELDVPVWRGARTAAADPMTHDVQPMCDERCRITDVHAMRDPVF